MWVGNEIEARFPFAIIVDVNPVVYKTSLRESTIRYQQQQKKQIAKLRNIPKISDDTLGREGGNRRC